MNSLFKAIALTVSLFPAGAFAYDTSRCSKIGEEFGWAFAATFVYMIYEEGVEGDQIVTYRTRHDFSTFYFEQRAVINRGEQSFKLRGGEKLFDPARVRSVIPNSGSNADIRIVFEDRNSDFRWETGGQVSVAGGTTMTWLDNERSHAQRLQNHMVSKRAERTPIVYEITGYVANGRGGWIDTGRTPMNTAGLVVMRPTIDRVLSELDRDSTIADCTDRWDSGLDD